MWPYISVLRLFLHLCFHHFDHGWAQDIEVLASLIWGASAMSIVVFQAFDSKNNTAERGHRLSPEDQHQRTDGIRAGFEQLTWSVASATSESNPGSQDFGEELYVFEQVVPTWGLYHCYLVTSAFQSLSQSSLCTSLYRQVLSLWDVLWLPRLNKHHIKAHSVMERASGMKKTRWWSIFLRHCK